jgi:glyoxylase-like metal-dependent hydrolase (beta-lactamase superfamily II)
MDNAIQTIPLGDEKVSIINIGDIETPMTTWMDPPAEGWPPEIAAVAGRRQRFAQNCIYARIGAVSLVVDPGVFDYAPDSPMLMPGYSPPPDLLSALFSLGVRPVDVTHIVITHAHHDHFNGLTVSRNGTLAPAFPMAHCYLGKADYERPEIQKALEDPASLESRTFGVLKKAGLLELSSGTQLLGDGVQIIAAPGETPGHQMVRIESGGQSLYCVGDLIHAPLEIEQPQYMVRWAEPQATVASRRALSERAAAENALVVATHIHGAARLRRTDEGFSWLPR